MAKKDSKGRWIDAAGNHIPAKYVDAVAKKRDPMVERLHREATKVQDRLTKFKELARAEIDKYLDWLAASNNEKELNQGGNYKLDNFSGNLRIELKVHKINQFDERIQLARQKIERCAERWAEGANENLQVVVANAFAVDKRGNFDNQKILGLRNWKIKDREWKEAMDLITDSLSFAGTREYLMFQVRDTPDSEWRTIRLDLAGV